MHSSNPSTCSVCQRGLLCGCAVRPPRLGAGQRCAARKVEVLLFLGEQSQDGFVTGPEQPRVESRRIAIAWLILSRGVFAIALPSLNIYR
jgi:hypothetical protein